MEHISNLVLLHGYVLIFALVFLDQAAVSIPSPPFVAALGVLASHGRFNIVLAFAIVFGAAFVADCLWFGIGRSAAKRCSAPARSRYWHKHFPKIVNLVRRGVIGAILSVKFSLLPSALVPLAAGSARLTTRRFLCMTGVGNLAWTTVYLIGGFNAGYAIMKLLSGTTMLIAAVLACLLFLGLPVALQRSLRRGHRPCSQ